MLRYGVRKRKWILLHSFLESMTVLIIGLVLYAFLTFWYKKIVWIPSIVISVSIFFIQLLFFYFSKRHNNDWGTVAKIEIKNEYLNGLFQENNYLLENELEVIQSDLKGLDKLDIIYEDLFPAIFKNIFCTVLFLVVSIVFHSFIIISIGIYFLIVVTGLLFLEKKGKKINRLHLYLFMQLGKRFYSDLTGINTLIMYQQDAKYYERFMADSEKYRKSTMALLAYQLKSLFFLGTSLFFCIIMSAFTINLEIKQGVFSTASGVAIFGMLFFWFLDMQKIGYYIHVVKSTIPIFKKIFKVIEQGKNMNTKIKLNERVQKITIENLTFRYNKETIIEKLSAKFINGVPYYIIGSNGSGKSTLGRLIAGLLQPNDGKIEWNSTSLSTIDKGNRISKIGYLQSNPFLFEGTIEENLMLKDSSKDYKELLRKNNLCGFVSDLEEKFQTKVGPNGRFLSPGQRQQVAFARFFLNDKDVYIFDEVTSNVDKITSQQMMQAMKYLAKDRIVIIITHHLEKIPKDSEVFFMSQHKIKLLKGNMDLPLLKKEVSN